MADRSRISALAIVLAPSLLWAQPRAVAPASQLSAIVGALASAASAGPAPLALGTLAPAASAVPAPLAIGAAELEKLSLLSRRLASVVPTGAPAAAFQPATALAPAKAWEPLRAELASLSSREIEDLPQDEVHALAQRVMDRVLGLESAERGALDAAPTAAADASLGRGSLARHRPASARAPAAVEGPLVRVSPNPSQHGVTGRFLVDGSPAGVPVTVPQAAGLAAAVARSFAPGVLRDASLTRITIVADPAQLPVLAASPSGKVRRKTSGRITVDTDGDYRQVYLPKDVLGPRLAPPSPLPAVPFRAEDGVELEVPRRHEPRIGARLESGASVFVGGLISVSAEPPEGFFAASSQADFAKRGRRVTSAAEAEAWVYRVPDARRSSYFDFQHASPDRPEDSPRDAKFKIAAGIGPAHDPASPGGDEADLLWLGDEQHGALDGLLKDLERPDASLGELLEHQGFGLRLSPNTVALSGLDKAHALTKEGFNALETDPKLYRRVFSTEYDAYLATLFEPPAGPKAKATYLLATSRGCSQGCAICCSGGLSQFQYFDEERMLAELRKLSADAGLKPNDVANVFFVDSNFNNSPARLVRFAELYAASELAGRFRFFVRHNTVNGFLKPDAEGVKRPNRELIAAYATLGIREVFMGVDAYDDAGTLTLKTNRVQLARLGTNARPTYTYAELRELIRAFETAALSAKGFFLTNNPWVGDLDRVDSWFNLLELWLENPHFSIDTREREVLRLKPFAGSPITEVAERRGLPVIEEGRFSAKGPLGALDELMEFSALGRPRAKAGAGAALAEFRASLAKVRAAALGAADDQARSEEDRKAARLVLRKLLERERNLEPQLSGLKEPEAEALLAELRDFRSKNRALEPFDPAEQRRAFGAASSSLIEGLAELENVARPAISRGYRPELSSVAGPHTLKQVPDYLADNLGHEALAAVRGSESPFLLVVGDGRTARAAAQGTGWKLLERLAKREGFHQVYRARAPGGKPGFAVVRINGDDRVTHLQSLLALAGLPGERLTTIGKSVSWKTDYLRTFKQFGPAPDAVLYGFANTAVEQILLRNKLRNALYFFGLSSNYDFKRSPLREDEHDLAHLMVQELFLENGKRVWLLHCMYGDLAKDLLEAVIEHGARNIAFLGTAGVLTADGRVLDILTPAHRVRADGSREPLDWLTPVAGARRAGGYLRVATPNIETEAWRRSSVKRGATVTEVELGYVLDIMRKHPEVRFRAGLVVSDVLAGDGRSDMTEWGLRQLRRLLPAIGKVLDQILEQSGSGPYRVKRYRTVPLAS
ncbi:MAG: hypothetical protein HY554_13780 [Elusimicrobia bacterium]|nr:hypothetical protein [Elusimicrobiota bacterium]